MQVAILMHTLLMQERQSNSGLVNYLLFEFVQDFNRNIVLSRLEFQAGNMVLFPVYQNLSVLFPNNPT